MIEFLRKCIVFMLFFFLLKSNGQADSRHWKFSEILSARPLRLQLLENALIDPFHPVRQMAFRAFEELPEEGEIEIGKPFNFREPTPEDIVISGINYRGEIAVQGPYSAFARLLQLPKSTASLLHSRSEMSFFFSATEFDLPAVENGGSVMSSCRSERLRPLRVRIESDGPLDYVDVCVSNNRPATVQTALLHHTGDMLTSASMGRGFVEEITRYESNGDWLDFVNIDLDPDYDLNESKGRLLGLPEILFNNSDGSKLVLRYKHQQQKVSVERFPAGDDLFPEVFLELDVNADDLRDGIFDRDSGMSIERNGHSEKIARLIDQGRLEALQEMVSQSLNYLRADESAMIVDDSVEESILSKNLIVQNSSSSIVERTSELVRVSPFRRWSETIALIGGWTDTAFELLPLLRANRGLSDPQGLVTISAGWDGNRHTKDTVIVRTPKRWREHFVDPATELIAEFEMVPPEDFFLGMASWEFEGPFVLSDDDDGMASAAAIGTHLQKYTEVTTSIGNGVFNLYEIAYRGIVDEIFAQSTRIVRSKRDGENKARVRFHRNGAYAFWRGELNCGTQEAITSVTLDALIVDIANDVYQLLEAITPMANSSLRYILDQRLITESDNNVEIALPSRLMVKRTMSKDLSDS